MKAQRGNVYVVLALALAAGLVLWGLVSAWSNYTASLDRRGYDRGVQETTAAYAKRDNAALRNAIAEKEAAERRVAALESDAAKKVTTADANYQKGLTNGKASVDAVVARVHAGYRLRDPGGTATGPSAKPDGAARPSAFDPGQRDGQARADLPAAAGCSLSAGRSEFLIRLAGEADDVVRQLTACQATLKAVHEFALKLSHELSGIGFKEPAPDGPASNQAP